MPEVKFKGVKLHFTDQGKGRAIIFLHGFLENCSMWKKIVPELQNRYRVVCIDLPGHGKSECIGYVHTMDEMAEAVFKVVRTLKLRKVTMIGHSMGGYVALAFAERFPDNVKSLVLYQSTAKADSDERKNNRNRAIELVKQNHKSFVRKAVPQLFRPVNRKKFKTEMDWAKNEALSTPVQGIIAALGGMRDRPNREILLKFPPYSIHIVAADKDPIIAYNDMVELASISDQVRLHTIKGCGHMSYIENPEATIAGFNIIMKQN
ncbi:MAG: alpha/beta hydrolase [Salibacteraceae bacterium]